MTTSFGLNCDSSGGCEISISLLSFFNSCRVRIDSKNIVLISRYEEDFHFLKSKSLPVHWYHLFVSIRYHKNNAFARWNTVQMTQKVFVGNTDLRERNTKGVDIWFWIWYDIHVGRPAGCPFFVVRGNGRCCDKGVGAANRRPRATGGRPYEKTGSVPIESVGAICDRPLRATKGRPYERTGEMK